MRAHGEVGWSEVLLSLVAIRLSAIVLTATTLLLLPPQPHHNALVYVATRGKTEKHVASEGERLRANSVQVHDMLFHD
jgi:hypothetical protein